MDIARKGNISGCQIHQWELGKLWWGQVSPGQGPPAHRQELQEVFPELCPKDHYSHIQLWQHRGRINILTFHVETKSSLAYKYIIEKTCSLCRQKKSQCLANQLVLKWPEPWDPKHSSSCFLALQTWLLAWLQTSPESQEKAQHILVPMILRVFSILSSSIILWFVKSIEWVAFTIATHS